MSAKSKRIDAHIHLWHFDERELTWLDPSTSAVIRRDFLLSDLIPLLSSRQIDAAIAVQARRSLAETEWLLSLAEESSSICGVVGWVPLMDQGINSILEKLIENPKMVAVREMVQSQPKGFLEEPSFNRGIELLTRHHIAYDLLIHANQIEEATKLVDRHPNQRFILDHAAKPRIALAEVEPWRSRIMELARRENVSCKISGLATEANWNTWTPPALYPYLDACVESFRPHRLLVGSDWPVCLLATSYSAWWDVLEQYFAAFSIVERQAIFGGNALNSYPAAIHTLKTT
jgi:L-fuconolactonase